MQRILIVLRLFLGALFIFSALIKANDPLGLSYKIEEFMQSMHLSWLSFANLGMAIFIICVEGILGLAIFLGLWSKLFLVAGLYLNLGFLALTGYAFFFAKIKACGCFGDCIPIDAKSSFYKDIVLCVINLFLVFHIHKIRPLLSIHKGLRIVNIFGILVLSLCLFTYYRLPIIDCLAFKIGTNISQSLTKLSNQNDLEVYFNYRKNGQIVTFKSTEFPNDFDDSYSFVSRTEKQIQTSHNQLWSIKDFKLFNDLDQEYTYSVLGQKACSLLFIRNFNSQYSAAALNKQLTQVNNLFPNQIIYVIVRRDINHLKQILKNTNVRALYCDNTLMKTIARSKITLYNLEHGVIIYKTAL